MNQENQKLLKVVDDALKECGDCDVEVHEDEDGVMFDVNICYGSVIEPYFVSVARIRLCDLEELEKELDKKHVGKWGW